MTVLSTKGSPSGFRKRCTSTSTGDAAPYKGKPARASAPVAATKGITSAARPAKLVAVAETQRAADVAAIRGDAVKAEWGQQIRNYVIHPYKMVKDVRTGKETSDVDGVMSGNLDEFMDEFLRWKRKTEAEEAAALAANT